MKYQNQLKEIESAGYYKVPSIFMAVALEADKEIAELKEKNANLLKHIKGLGMLIKNLRTNKRVIE